MRGPDPLILSPQDKLDALRMLDEFHFWHSLDDVRFCTECHRSFTGQVVQVIESRGTRGRLHLQCPTEGCCSVPSQWIYDDPVRAAAGRGDTGSFGSRQWMSHASVAVSHHGHACTIRLDRIGRHKERAFQFSRTEKANQRPSIRTVLARLAFLSPIATGLHRFHPVT
jgi:hypothetical protein